MKHTMSHREEWTTTEILQEFERKKRQALHDHNMKIQDNFLNRKWLVIHQKSVKDLLKSLELTKK